MSDKFRCVIIRPNPTIRYPLCFREQARLIVTVLRELGMQADFRENKLDPDATNIVFSWHDYDRRDKHPVRIIRDNKIILYQGEQITPGGRLLPDWYYQSLKECHEVWDYSVDNIDIMLANGVDRVKHVPPAWHPMLATMDRSVEQDVDVLFFGCVNARREFVIKQLGRLCRTGVLVDTWGPERDQFIERAKVVLNVHFYQAQTLELLRLAPLLSNRVPVVSEASGVNPYGEGIRMVHYRDLVPAVMQLVSDDEMRAELGNKGHDEFLRLTMTEVLSRALGLSTETTATEQVSAAAG